MSTRANIILEEMGNHLWLYHHCDGYQSYLGDTLMKFMVTKHKKDYADIYDIANELFKDNYDTGFELTSQRHGDIEYMYIINIENKTIECIKTEFDNRYNDKSLCKVKYNDDEDIQKWYEFCKKD